MELRTQRPICRTKMLCSKEVRVRGSTQRSSFIHSGLHDPGYETSGSVKCLENCTLTERLSTSQDEPDSDPHEVKECTCKQ
jgi:hypothetical protein